MLESVAEGLKQISDDDLHVMLCVWIKDQLYIEVLFFYTDKNKVIKYPSFHPKISIISLNQHNIFIHNYNDIYWIKQFYQNFT